MTRFIKLSSIICFSLIVSSPVFATVAQSPLFLVNSVDPNVLFNMSVESPMGGAAYNDQADVASGCGGRISISGDSIGVCYSKTQEYLGYFDPNKCYVYSGGQFNPSGATNSDHECSGKFSGNMMNWATMTAVDEFTWTMTGGNRVVDSTSETVIQRARKQNNNNWFPHKRLKASNNVSPSTVTPWGDTTIYIYNTDFGVQFGTSVGGSQKGTYNLKLRVCDSAQGLEANCIPYGYDSDGDDVPDSTIYKPEGLVQRNSSSMRFGVTSYSNTNGNEIGGGVLRSNMKYVGPSMPDGSGGTIANSNAEIDAEGGRLIHNPNPVDASESGVSYSGVIPYLNRFSGPGYKGNDPASELYYESLRYFKNLGPTSDYTDGENVDTNGDGTGDVSVAPANGGFPIIDNTGNSTWEDPIEFSCQKHFIIGINDANPWADKKLPGTHFTSRTFNGYNIQYGDFGEPSDADADINVTTLTNTVGDLEGLTNTSQCVGCTASSCDMAANNKTITALGEVFGTCPAIQKENSYYIAGLAYYANTQDIRDDKSGVQNITTFMIDSQEFNDNPLTGRMNMLWLAGKYGGFVDENDNDEPDLTSEWDADGDGEPDNYVLATKPEKMISALNQAFQDIEDKTSSSASVATNSTRLDTNTKLYQARFDSAKWTGQFLAFDINTDGSVGSLLWDAATLVPAEASRKIYSFDRSDNNGDSVKGMEFTWDDLSAAQQTSLNISATGVPDAVGSEQGSDRLDFVRGDTSNEGDDIGDFRVRTSALGDITNSDPWFIGTLEDLGYNILDGAEGSSYDTFRVTKRSRTAAVYVGANDGMLHAFNADTGAELFSYIPNEVIGSLTKLSSQLYGCEENGCIAHRYFVDGSSRGADAYFDSAWHTVLVGSLGAGGKAVFALDVTTPSSFDKTNVLWEISTTQAYDATDLAEFQANLGYTIPQSSIVRLNNDKWAAVVANGYESANHKAVLYLIDIETGQILKTFDTEIGDASNPNGLSTPVAVDINGDRIADTVYAGDLLGNLWKFDLTGNANGWGVAFSSGSGNNTVLEPLYKACDADPCTTSPSNHQPITAKPQVGLHSADGVMVYFGTGKYYAVNDQIVGNSPQVQNFYGIRDVDEQVSGTNVLQEQTILAEATLTFNEDEADEFDIDVRVTTDIDTDYEGDEDATPDPIPAKQGWFMKLLSPVNGAEGERVVVAPLLRGGRIIFVTMTPESDPCGWGGTSWLMELEAESGSRLETSPFDIDGDGYFSIDDFVQIYDFDGDGDVDNDDGYVPTSGVRNKKIGIIKTPGVVVCEDGKECKYTSGTSGDLDMIKESSGSPTGRQSWNQIK